MKYSLRFLLLATGGLAILLALVLLLTQEYRRRLALESALLTKGASYVHFNEQGDVTIVFSNRLASNSLKGLGILRNVELQGFDVNGETLAALSQSDGVESLMFQSCSVGDPRALERLARIPGLKHVHFWNTSISDSALTEISHISGLKAVSFRATKVTRGGADTLSQSVRDLKVHHQP